MSLIRAPRRHHGRGGCRPRLETLEVRTLLSGLDAVEPKILASATRDLYDVDGTGYSAAMIDTGVDYTHPALGGDGYGPGHKVIDGWDFSKGKPDPYPVHSHGTLTAGLVASNAPGHLGVAPGANIVALRVIGDDGSGSYTRVLDALQYVIDNAERDKISVVNISLSDGGNYSYDFFSRDNSIGQKIARMINKLAEMRIPVVSASGNSFDGSQGMGFTAILPQTISVTATDKDDNFLSNAQRLGAGTGFAAATDLAAPGKDIEAPTGSNGYTTVEGTSFAAPMVTGGIILLQQIYQQRYGMLPKVSDVDAWLKGGATTLHDPVTGIDIGRLDIAKSASLIPDPTPPPAPVPQTQVFVDGVLQTTVPSTSDANPLVDFGADAGFTASFDLIQFWQNGGSTAITSVPGGGNVNNLGEHFRTVEIWNAKPVGIETGETQDATPAQGTETDTLRTAVSRVFSHKAFKAAKGIPRPSRFARAGRRR